MAVTVVLGIVFLLMQIDRLRAPRPGGPDALVRDVRDDLLHADRVPRRARLRRRDHARRRALPRPRRPVLRHATTTRSRRRRCTGTSSTSSGSCCSRSSTCCPARPRRARSRSPCIRSVTHATPPWSGSSSSIIGVVYWVVPYVRRLARRLRRGRRCSLPRRRDGAHGLRPGRRILEGVTGAARSTRADPATDARTALDPILELDGPVRHARLGQAHRRSSRSASRSSSCSSCSGSSASLRGAAGIGAASGGSRAADAGRHPHARARRSRRSSPPSACSCCCSASSSAASILVLGAIALVLTLLYWLAEGLRIYDHDVGTSTRHVAPAVVIAGPPPGVHMPGPSFRPFLGAFGVFLLLVGLVFGGWLLLAGVIALIATLVGWLVDALKEYVRDRRGRPDRPSREHPRAADAVGDLSAPGRPGRRRDRSSSRRCSRPTRPTAGPAAGRAAGAGARRARGARRIRRRRRRAARRRAVQRADVLIEAKNITVRRDVLHGPGRQAVHDRLRQPGRRHAPQHRAQGRGRHVGLQGRDFNGVATKIYDVPALPAGTYTFLCIVHPTMTGNATTQ